MSAASPSAVFKRQAKKPAGGNSEILAIKKKRRSKYDLCGQTLVKKLQIGPL
jgi:hypothetical protein